MKIRTATAEDAAAIAAIYNFYVENSHSTFETEAVSEAEMRSRILTTLENYPFPVCESRDEIVGYAFAASYKKRAAYRFSVEVLVYVKNGVAGKGIGTALYESLFEGLKPKSVHAVIAGIALPNYASIRLHEKFDFEKIAHFHGVGFKFEKWVDVGYWEKIMKNKSETQSMQM